MMLAQATVESPFAGWVSAKHAEVGDLVAPGSPMFTIEALDPVKIVVDVPESSVRALAVGGKARVEIDAVGGRFDALIDRILPAGDQRARTFGVQLVLPNPEGVLKSGLFARAIFELGSTEVLIVPARALVERGQLQGLFVVDASSVAQLRWVRIGARRHDESGAVTGDRVEILSGLSPDERYVTEPPPELVDGMVIEGVTAASPNSENASAENTSDAEARP
ncbi:MAG: efflux RND transporter periplasmic adaptor subunit [Thermoanaerobaculia bacterium]|nr:efflux RND transporter periplasmic adaptor subunit [Thermoanaerobaculia bacterium]